MIFNNSQWLRNDSQSCLDFFHKLVDEYNNAYANIIMVLPVRKFIEGDCFAFPEELGSVHEASNFKVGATVIITRYNNTFSEGRAEK